MNINEKMHAIDEYITSGGESIIHSYEPLFFMGQSKIFPVYKLPIELLTFNVDNGRFAAEKMLKEMDLGFEIDNHNPSHEDYFIELLLPNDGKSKRLLEDVKKHGQLVKGVITHEGLIVDANRRCATLKKLNKITPDSKYQYLLVQRLPANTPAKEIYKLEVQFQIKSDLKEDYNPINDLLKIREGLAIMNQQELGETLSWSNKTIEEYVKRLEIVDGFLTYIGQEGNYSILRNFNEHFVEIQKELRALDNNGVIGLAQSEAIDIMYKMLSLNLDQDFNKTITQRDHIRYIREAILDPKIKDVLTKNMFEENSSSEEIYTDITAATELIKIKRNNIKPLEKLKKVINLMAQIEDEIEEVNEEFLELFTELKDSIDSIQKSLEEK